MAKIVEKNWDPALLRQATLLTKGLGYMETYDLHNGKILKVLKSLEEVEDPTYQILYDDFVDDLYRKLFYVEDISHTPILLPDTVYFQEDGLMAYEVRKSKGISSDQYLSRVHNLELYGAFFRTLTESVKLMNQEGIIFPDLANFSNIFYREKENQFDFIDYDGIQIFDARAYSVGGLLEQKGNPILGTIKYQEEDGLYKENLDKLSLTLLFMYSTTGKNIMADISPLLSLYQWKNIHFDKENPPYELLFHPFFSKLDIEDTEMADLIERVFHPTLDNEYPEHAIYELTENYHLLTKGKRKYFQRKVL